MVVTRKRLAHPGVLAKHAVGFVPLPYQPENNDIPVQTPPTGFDALRTIAVSRIYLDNFDHITAYWVGLGLELAQRWR